MTMTKCDKCGAIVLPADAVIIHRKGGVIDITREFCVDCTKKIDKQLGITDDPTP
jgi:hypothetical protein